MNYFPPSLLGRNVALLLITVLVSQVVAVSSFVIFLQGPRIRDAAGFFASQIRIMERALDDVPEARKQLYIDKFSAKTTPPRTAQRVDETTLPRPIFAKMAMRTFLHALSADLPSNTALLWQPGDPAQLWVRLSISGAPYWVPLPVSRSLHHHGLWVAMVTSLLLSGIATLAAFAIHRRINRPLADLVAASNVVGRGQWPAPLAERGTLETVRLSRTFNEMTARLADIEATRAAMLAGISYDIRTPLTKLRLGLAIYAPSVAGGSGVTDMATEDGGALSTRATSRKLPDLEQYIDDIDVILQQFIDFARGTEGEPRLLGDVNAVIRQLAGDFAGLGFDFALRLYEPLPLIPFGQASILRLLMNLMENAVHYGQVGLAVSTATDAFGVHITVEDRGPGVPPPFLPLILQPFQRGNNTRGKDGTGLGLAIARRIAREHGGDLTVHVRRRGGLAFHVSLSTAGMA